MSYIRCLSNPEGLYVWSDVDGTVHLHYGGRRMVKPPLSKGEELRVPYKTLVGTASSACYEEIGTFSA